MSLPSGEIVARPMLVRACGCTQEFQHYAVDRFRAGQQAKFEATRCPACAAKLAARHELVPKQEAFARLPAGTCLTITRRPDGSWSGTLTADGATVEAERGQGHSPSPQPWPNSGPVPVRTANDAAGSPRSDLLIWPDYAPRYLGRRQVLDGVGDASPLPVRAQVLTQ